MKKFNTLFKYEFVSLCKSRWLWIYFGMFNIFLFALRYFSNDPQQLYVSTMNSVLFFHSVGLLLFSTLSWQNSSEFISLILTQPVSRGTVFLARLTSFYLCLGFFAAISLLIQMFTSLDSSELLKVLSAQILIQIIFIGLGFLLAIRIQDRLKAMAMATGLVLLFCLVLDGFTLWIIINYSAYPLEKVILGLSSLNPLTLIKYQNLADEKNALWIGYAGLILSRVWNSVFMKVLSTMALVVWLVGPASLAWLSFKRKDF